MLLAAIPGKVGDGSKISVENKMVVSGTEVTAKQDTFIGAALGEANLRRFLVAPKGAAVTGITETADGKTIFVNIQHPGESISAADAADPSKYLSHWPGNAAYGAGGALARPRAATVMVVKDDGGRAGS